MPGSLDMTDGQSVVSEGPLAAESQPGHALGERPGQCPDLRQGWHMASVWQCCGGALHSVGEPLGSPVGAQDHSTALLSLLPQCLPQVPLGAGVHA